LYQFDHGSWLENLAIGPSNSILATRLDLPALYQITLPPAVPKPSAKLIQTFPGATGALGITEYKKNQFLVILGNYSIPDAQDFPGTYSIWEVSFSGHDLDHISSKKVTDIPEAMFPNGMTNLPHTGTVLIADSMAGVVYRLCPETGEREVVHDDVTMHPPAGTALGVNGIHVITICEETFLYYTSSLKETLGRVRIDPISGRAIGPYETLTTGVWGDDFAYDSKTGDIYIAGNFANVITKVSRDGVKEDVIGSPYQLTVAGTTSMVFGGKGKRTLYAVTSGALASPVNGTVTEGAKLVAIEVDEI
jgi:sugar lactone lactonase YvrE